MTTAERLHLLATMDTIVAFAFGLSLDDVLRILDECDHPKPTAQSNHDPKGFWRVDKNKDPELRHTVLTLIAFHDLESKIQAVGGDREKGIEAFLAQNHGEGWLLPEALRLADYSLGHDERAQHPQPVARCLGPRFYDWQLVQSAEESWRECHLHARNLLGAQGYADLLGNLRARGQLDEIAHRRWRRLAGPLPDEQPALKVAETRSNFRLERSPSDGQSDLFK